VTPEQEREGLAREVMRKIQAARKSADFKLDDRIRLELCLDGALREAVLEHRDLICAETLATSFELVATPQGEHVEEAEIDGEKVGIGLKRDSVPI
jgi:isoleucyl-tRNA synthetase